MSQNNRPKSSTFMPNARERRSKMPETPKSLVTSSTAILPSQIVELPDSNSHALKAYADHDAKLAWDNSVRFQIARNLLKLRQFRKWSQSRLARLVGTSQPAIARIENETDNITADTMERVVHALHGRLRISISPEELELPHWGDWWDIIDTCAVSTSRQTLRLFGSKSAGGTTAVVALWTSKEQPTPSEPKQTLLATESVS